MMPNWLERLTTMLGEVTLCETHISWILLAGDYAYKIKKPVNFGFLDYSTLEKRAFYCAEELRLNRRWAPELYLDVVAITGNPARPYLQTAATGFEYAVKMRRFAQEDILADRLDAGRLTAQHLDALARRLAALHADSPIVTIDEEHVPTRVHAPVRENFVQMAPLLDETWQPRLAALREWSEAAYVRLAEHFAKRQASGHMRELHGDLHLRNIVLWHDQPLPFDGIEFNPALRSIDVINELAFTLMDLTAHGRGDWASRLLNHYLCHTGDYAGVALLNYYRVYRALVRAKIALLTRAGADSQAARAAETRRFENYFACAECFSAVARPQLWICRGLSGSGKSYAAAWLAERLSAIVVSSDIERKRLAGLPPLARSVGAQRERLYSHTFSEKTYRHLADTAAELLRHGHSVILDATCLTAAQRQLFYEVAERLALPYTLLDFQAPRAVLAARIEDRQAHANDPSEADVAVLDQQIAYQEPLTLNEMTHARVIDSGRENWLEQLQNCLPS